MKRKVLSIFVVLAMVLTLIHTMSFVASAEEGVPYTYYTNTVKHDDGLCTDYEIVTSEITTFEKDKWYVVSDDVTVSSRIVVNYTAYLIICDGATMNVPNGISVLASVNGIGNLHIYGQSAGTGTLKAQGNSYEAAIGGTSENDDVGKIFIESGTVIANGGYHAAGIGGSEKSISGDIYIYGGTVISNGGYGGAGIGSGSGHSGDITIYGGTVRATGGYGGAGIGGGSYGSCYCDIHGGNVTAIGGYGGAGIGSGRNADNKKVSIYGGMITAVAGADSSAIGGGDGGNGGSVYLYDGKVTAVGSNKYAIGGGYGGNGARFEIHGGNAALIGGDNKPAIQIYDDDDDDDDDDDVDDSKGIYFTIYDGVTFAAGSDVEHITVTGDKNNAFDALNKSFFITPIHSEHNFDKETAIPRFLKSAATCTQTAVYYKSCFCGTVGSETFTYMNPLGHSWNNGEITIHQTHETEGLKTYICSRCGETKTEALPKLNDHLFDQQIAINQYLKSEATCTNAAVYYKSCICGEKSAETFTVGNALGHNYPEKWEKEDATQHKKICDRCHTAIYEKHNWNNGEIIEIPTETKPGTIVYTCTSCGETKTYSPQHYIYYEADNTTIPHEGICQNYNYLTEDTTTFEDGEWYVVIKNTTVDTRITVNGTAHLILCDGASLDAREGIAVNEGNTLNIYAQSEGTGQLLSGAGSHQASIGGNSNYSCGTVAIHGGIITANGASGAAGIGGGRYGNGGIISIFAGKVVAVGEGQRDPKHHDIIYNGLGIGGGFGATDNGALILGDNVIFAVGEDPDWMDDWGDKNDVSKVFEYTCFMTHTHIFNMSTVAEKYLKSKATCIEAAVYYKSCECGQASHSETFTSGDALGHKFENGVCIVCGMHEPEGIQLNVDKNNFSVTLSGFNKNSGFVIVGLYENDNTDRIIEAKLFDISKNEIPQSSFKTKGKVKAFWWTDLETMTPLCNSVCGTIE